MLFDDKIRDYSRLDIKCPVCGGWYPNGADHCKECQEIMVKKYHDFQGATICIDERGNIIAPSAPGTEWEIGKGKIVVGANHR